MNIIKSLKASWHDDDNGIKSIILMFAVCIIFIFIGSMGIYGTYQLFRPSAIAWLLTAIVLTNSVLAAYFIAHAAPLMSLSAPSSANLLHTYGMLLPIFFLLLAVFGTYKAVAQ